MEPIDPWEIKGKNRLVTFNTLTILDTMNNLVKITYVDNKTCVRAINIYR